MKITSHNRMSTMVIWLQYVSAFMSIKPYFGSSKQVSVIMVMMLVSLDHGFVSSLNDYSHLNYNCPKNGVPYTLGSAFHENLNHTLFTQFSAIAADKSFSNFTIGTSTDRVYAYYYCRGDVDAYTCHRCIQSAIAKIVEVCELLKQGIIWYEECTLRYANHTIFNLDEVSPFHPHYNRTSLVSDYHLDPYKQKFDSTMKGLIDQAAHNESLNGFAIEEINLSSSETLRGLVQCTPFISSTLCEKCLRAAFRHMDVWFVTMALLPSCLVRYDLYGLPPPPPPPSADDPAALPVRYKILIAVLSVFVLASLGGFWLWRSRCSKVPKEVRTSAAGSTGSETNTRIEAAEPADSGTPGSKLQGFTRFTYSEVESMTDKLQKRLGQGAFGVVYYGRLKKGNTEVAVKMLSQGDAPKQFSNEIEVFGRISHKNLVSLYGYCEEGAALALIYEYMSGGDLKALLSSDAYLSWKKRLEIAFDTAQGLEYLHAYCSPSIVHRDVKPANILLDQHLQAKVADFGHSRIFPAEFVSRLNATIVGTPGYVDPQYFSTGLVNEKSDVYSFGVVLLELITGQKAILNTGTNLVQWVKPLIDRGDIGSILDPKLRVEVGENYNSVWRATELAKRCVELDGINRPAMTEIIMELNDCLVSENMDVGSSSSAPTTTTAEMMSAFYSFSSMRPQAR